MERAVFQNAVSPLYLEHIYYGKDKRRLKVREYHIFNAIFLTVVTESRPCAEFEPCLRNHKNSENHQVFGIFLCL